MKCFNLLFNWEKSLNKGLHLSVLVFIIFTSNQILLGQGAPVIQPLPSEILQVANTKTVTVSAQAAHPVDANNIKVVVLGSSTAEGLGASDPATTAWVPLLTAYISSTYPGSEVVNLGKAGFTSYRILPTGTPTPTGYEPRENRNITKALSLKPDIILINLPSNDVDKRIASEVTIENLLMVKQVAEQEGVIVYLTTTQPRHDSEFTVQQSLKLRQQAQMIRDAFGVDVIDIYDELATDDNEIKPIYDSGDHIHLSDSGHQYIFNTVKPKLDSLIKENFITITASNLPAFASALPTGNGKLNIIFSPEVKDANSKGTININAINGNGVNSQIAFDYQVPKISQTLTFAELGDKVFGDIPFELSAISSSGLPVTFEIVSGPAILTNNVLYIEGAGIITVRALQPGTENYDAAEPVERSLEVKKAPQTINFLKPADKTYLQNLFSLEGTTSSGLPVYFRIISGPAYIDTLHKNRDTLHITGTGTVTVKAEQPGNKNFLSASPVTQTFTILKSAQQITFNPLPDRMFGDGAFEVNAESSSGLSIQYSIVSGSATLYKNQLTLNCAGLVTVRATQSGNNNFEPAEPVEQNFTVHKASQTINFDPIDNKKSNNAPFTLHAVSSGGLPVSFSVESGPAAISGNTVILTGEGGDVMITASQEGNENYETAPDVRQSFTVTALKAQTITFNPIADHFKDDPAFAIEATSSADLPVTFEIVSGPASINNNIITINGTGTIVVRAIQEGNDDFLSAPPVERSFRVEEVTGIAGDIAGAGIKIFPNPAEAQIYLEANDNRWYGAQVTITDAMGKNIAYYTLASEKLAMDLRGKRAGLYLLMLRKNQDFFVLRFVKE